MELKDIRQIIDLMKRNDLSLFQLEREGFKVKLRRGVDFDAPQGSGPIAYYPQPAGGAPAGVGIATAPVPAIADAAPAATADPTLNSILVGTFYRSPAPGEKPYINVGDTVDENTTICIVEAMKVNNEIKADRRGVIKRVLVEDASTVQYDTPLFEITEA